MQKTEKCAVAALVLFAFLCGLILLLHTEPAVRLDHAAAYTRDTLDPRSLRERMDQALGITEAAPETAGRLDINTATTEELSALPGIGEVLADRIIRYRTYNGPFAEPSHIRDVTGIGDGVYAKIAELICVGE